MLGLERATIFLPHQLRDVIHQRLIARHLAFALEALREDEVKIALQRMAKQDRLGVTMPLEDLRQRTDAFRQPLDGEGDILDDHGGPQITHCTDRREQPLADLPVQRITLRILSEGPRLAGLDAFQHAGNLGHARLQLLMMRAPHIHQQRDRLFRQGAQHVRHARCVLHGAQRRAVHQLHRRDRCHLQQHGGATGRIDVRVVHQRRRLVRLLDHGAVGNGGDEAQRAFRTDHQMLEDLETIGIVDQRIEAITGGVLEPVLVADALGQLRVGAHTGRHAFQLRQQTTMTGAKGLHALRRGRIQAGAIGENDAQVLDGAITVVCRAAAHAGRIVGRDTADHATVDRSRVRADLASEGGQQLIGTRPDHPRLQADATALLQHLRPSPLTTQLDEHRIRQRLTGQ